MSTHDRSATVTGPVGAVPNARATEGAVEGRRLRSALLRAMLLCVRSRVRSDGDGSKKNRRTTKNRGKHLNSGTQVAS